jgi:hypothetical protein
VVLEGDVISQMNTNSVSPSLRAEPLHSLGKIDLIRNLQAESCHLITHVI